MTEVHTKMLKDFYAMVAFLLEFECVPETVKVEQDVLDLICKIYGYDCQEKEMLWEHIEAARSLQVFSDEMWLQNHKLSSDDSCIALQLRLEVLRSRKIDRLKPFNSFLFTNEIKKQADLGQRDSCKLLACLNWTGTIIPKNRKMAIKLWSALAISGDCDEIGHTLIYAYKQEGNMEEAQKWENVLSIIRTEFDSFSSVALPTNYKQYSESELGVANLIMCIRHRNARSGIRVLDRPLLDYVFQSKDSFEAKMEKITNNSTNFFTVLSTEDQSIKRFGF